MKLWLALLSVVLCAAVPLDTRELYDSSHLRYLKQGKKSTSLQVDLGYQIYQGSFDNSTGLDVWLGIRFAAPPIGTKRWQAPQAPAINHDTIVQADKYSAYCPQSFMAGATSEPDNTGASEDCLFLNVWSPHNATTPLPVFVWIHGGGYGQGSGQYDPSNLINTNGNNFIGVSIQYRLEAFGFLSSDEVFRSGALNAGLLDQHFALQWVQNYINLFNGDPSKVTLAGESAGAGSVMLQDMAYGGTVGQQYYNNIIAASPYLLMQYGYQSLIPSQSYYAFAAAAGCINTNTTKKTYKTIFECLVSKDTIALINASAKISQTGAYGTWAFKPVTDGVFIQMNPSQQLLQKKVNARNALIGNNADEGPLFTPQVINTEADLLSWLKVTFPLFTNDDLAKILLYYPSTNASVSPSNPSFATTGDSGPTALNQSDVGTGQQQRADNIYAETTFVCPSYWLAEAHSGNSRSSYKYQYSVPVSFHGADVTVYFNNPTPPTPNQGPDFVLAFRTILGNFVTKSNPSIPDSIASTNGSSANEISAWPPFTVYAPYQINLNETGGHLAEVPTPSGLKVPEEVGLGLKNDFELVNAYTWEGGRGFRCDFWRAMAAIVPE